MNASQLRRPNGGSVLVTGWSTFAVGAILCVIGISMPIFSDPGSYSSSPYIPSTPPTVNAWKWPVTWLGLGLTNIGVLLVAVGYIVRAMFFLPGREVSRGEINSGVYSSPPLPAYEAGAVGNDSPQTAQVDGTDKLFLAWAFGIAIAVCVAIFAVVALTGGLSSAPAPTPTMVEDIGVVDPLADNSAVEAD